MHKQACERPFFSETVILSGDRAVECGSEGSPSAQGPTLRSKLLFPTINKFPMFNHASPGMVYILTNDHHTTLYVGITNNLTTNFGSLFFSAKMNLFYCYCVTIVLSCISIKYFFCDDYLFMQGNGINLGWVCI